MSLLVLNILPGLDSTGTRDMKATVVICVFFPPFLIGVVQGHDKYHTDKHSGPLFYLPLV